MNWKEVFGWVVMIGVLVAGPVGYYFYLDMRQAALERQGIKMSKADIWLLDPQVRIVNGKAEITHE
jgi:hypothetical protein